MEGSNTVLDRRIIREEPQKVRAALDKRGYDFDLDALVELEARRREQYREASPLRHLYDR